MQRADAVGARLPSSTTMKAARRAARRQQVQQRHPEIDDLADQPAVGGRRSAEGQRDSLRRRGDASTAACCPGPRPRQWLEAVERRLGRSDDQDRGDQRRTGSGGDAAGHDRSTARSRRRCKRRHPDADRHADDRALRHRRERLPRARREELRLLSRDRSRARRSPRCTATPSSCPSTRSARRSRSSTKRWSRPSPSNYGA